MFAPSPPIRRRQDHGTGRAVECQGAGAAAWIFQVDNHEIQVDDVNLVERSRRMIEDGDVPETDIAQTRFQDDAPDRIFHR